MKRELIALVAHDINRAYCASLGDDSQPAWDDAPEWQRNSVMAGVDMHIANPDATPEQSHESWLAQKVAEGWTYGEVKDVIEKKHPCCVPYDKLPAEQKSKDYLFRAVVNSLKDIPDAEEAVAEFIQNMPVANAPVSVMKPVVNCTAIEYIGPHDVWHDRVYHTGLTFTKGMVRTVPNVIASKLLRHSDVFAKAELTEGEDDTGYQLDEGDKEKAKRDQQQRDFDVIDQVNAMTDRDSLIEFALSRYAMKLPRTMKPETMKGKIVDHINRFGSV